MPFRRVGGEVNSWPRWNPKRIYACRFVQNLSNVSTLRCDRDANMFVFDLSGGKITKISGHATCDPDSARDGVAGRNRSPSRGLTRSLVVKQAAGCEDR